MLCRVSLTCKELISQQQYKFEWWGKFDKAAEILNIVTQALCDIALAMRYGLGNSGPFSLDSNILTRLPVMEQWPGA